MNTWDPLAMAGPAVTFLAAAVLVAAVVLAVDLFRAVREDRRDRKGRR